MTPDRWRKIKSILEEAVEVAPVSRALYLEEICGSDADLRREVENLLDFDDARADLLEQAAVSAVLQNGFNGANKNRLIGAKIGSYKIVREIGAGGMGAVYLATRDDGEFDQKVAVKLIKNGMNTAAVRRRFSLERQILASLEHPNIARLIDGGTTADGLPYFVLEYVEGKPITEYAADKKLTLTERLDLFRQVCAAVSYAHARLVVHRDLKPSNILVTSDGQPKLLDFGIARLLNYETDRKETQTAAFTPEYASPEQLRGEQLTTATDIYSLGVVLYELLTEARPFSFENKNFGEIIESASRIEPPRPSSISSKSLRNSKFKVQGSKSESESRITNYELRENPKSEIPTPKSLRGDLDNIVLKALQKEPERRYQSAREFSEDIRRHLRGLPVSARPDTFGYRAEKFVRRNPLVCAALLVAVLSLTAGIIMASYQAAQAEREREIAQKRFNEVRQLANSFVFEINDEIDKSPIKARELLVKRAIEYLDKLSQEAGGDVSLQMELAAAYEKIGDVQAELYRPNLGETHEAVKSYAKALKIRRELFDKQPQNAQIGLDLSASYVKTGDVSAKTGNINTALENYRQAVNLNENFAALAPADLKTRRELAQSLLKLGQALLRTGKLSEVLANYRRSLEIYEQLARENPADVKLQRAPAVVLNYIGYVLQEKGDYDQSLETFRKSLEIIEKIYQSGNDSRQARNDTAVFNHWLGIAYNAVGDNQKSLQYHQKSQAITRALLAEDATDIEQINTLADSQMETAKTLIGLNRINEALKSFGEAVGNYEKVQIIDKDNKHVRRQIYYTKLYLADALLKDGKTNQALRTYDESLNAFEKLANDDPHNKEWQRDLAVSNLKFGEILLKKGEKKEASERFQEAREILEPLVAETPEFSHCQNDLETVKNYIGKLSN